jgi:hypothetical protein
MEITQHPQLRLAMGSTKPSRAEMRYFVSLYGPGNLAEIKRGTPDMDQIDRHFFNQYAQRYGINEAHAPQFFREVNLRTNKVIHELVSKIFPNNGKDIRAPERFESISDSPSRSVAATYPHQEEQPIASADIFRRQALLHDTLAQIQLRESRYNYPERMTELQAAMDGMFSRTNEQGELNVKEKYIFSAHDNETNKAEKVSEREEEIDARMQPDWHKKASKMRVYEVDGIDETGKQMDVSVFYRVKSDFSASMKAIDKAAREDGYVNIDRDVKDVDGCLIVVNEALFREENKITQLEPMVNYVKKNLYAHYGDAATGGRIREIVDDDKTNEHNRSKANREFRRMIVKFTDGTDHEVIIDTTQGFLNAQYQTGEYDKSDPNSLPNGLDQDQYNLVRIEHALKATVPQKFQKEVTQALRAESERIAAQKRQKLVEDFTDDGMRAILERFKKKKEDEGQEFELQAA